MDDRDHPCDAKPSARRRPDYHWIPIAALEPGMVLAKPVSRGAGHVTTILLAAKSRLTASTIVQMISRGVESVAVQSNVHLDEEVYAAHVLQYEARLGQIFGESPDEDCRALLDALLAAGPDVD